MSGSCFMDLDKLEHLERWVDRLVEQHRRTKQARAEAEGCLQERDTEFKGMNERVRRYERERVLLKDRLTEIIGRFEHLDLP